MILRILKGLVRISGMILRILEHLAYFHLVSFTLLLMISRILKGLVRTLRMIPRIVKYLE